MIIEVGLSINLVSFITHHLSLIFLVTENLYGHLFFNHICKFSFVSRCFYKVVVYPVVVSASWFPSSTLWYLKPCLLSHVSVTSLKSSVLDVKKQIW